MQKETAKTSYILKEGWYSLKKKLEKRLKNKEKITKKNKYKIELSELKGAESVKIVLELQRTVEKTKYTRKINEGEK